MRSFPMLKCSSERWVCAPHSFSAGTSTSPRLSVSLRIAAISFLLSSRTRRSFDRSAAFPAPGDSASQTRWLSRYRVANGQYQQEQHKPQHPPFLEVENQRGSRRGSQEEADPYCIEKADAQIVCRRRACSRKEILSFGDHETCNHSREIGCVNADPASTPERSVLQSQCEREAEHKDFNSYCCVRHQREGTGNDQN